MFDYEYRPETSVGRVVLEISLKPFAHDLSDAGLEAVVRDMLRKWERLLDYSTGCSVLLWTSDGSEILEYTGNPEDEFEWAKYIGLGNWDRSVPKEQRPPSLVFPIHFMENPPKMTFGDLARIIAAIKRVGRERGLDIKVGETFDPGPEFARSDFKYNRHAELAKTDYLDMKSGWIHFAARLHAEARAYAAYPDGIPEGTHIGEFLGRQFMAMRKDLGFDYIWLSNGFGFALKPGDYTGEIFDGESFRLDELPRIRENLAEFWEYFSRELGDTVIEVRGTNLATGVDIAAHGTPIDLIYRQNLIAPPNSPWAAIDSRFGLELSGYMSHIAELPRRGYSFRYYSHDIWWMNSPWFDRYDRSPHDIYLPLSVGRFDEKLNVTKPGSLEFLSADDSFGRIPVRGANEMTPHLLSAYNDYPDEPGLVTWIYPFNEYCRIGLHEGHPERIYMDDWLIESAIDRGFPLNSVISDANFIKADKSRFSETILVTPVPEAGSKLEAAIFAALEAGAKIMLYGSTRFASAKMRELIGVRLADGISGELQWKTTLELDSFEEGDYPEILTHDPLLSNGAVEEIVDTAEALATVSSGSITRAFATAKGNLVWIRGSFPHMNEHAKRLPKQWKPDKRFIASTLLRAALAKSGIELRCDAFSVNTRLPLVLFSRCRRATFINMYSGDTNTRIFFKTPDGAPIPVDCDVMAQDGGAYYPTLRSLHGECRIFVRQQQRSSVRVKHMEINYRNQDEKLRVDGLRNANVTLFVPRGGSAIIRKNNNLMFSKNGDLEVEHDTARDTYTVRNVSGTIFIGFQAKENFGDYKKLEFLRDPD